VPIRQRSFTLGRTALKINSDLDAPDERMMPCALAGLDERIDTLMSNWMKDSTFQLDTDAHRLAGEAGHFSATISGVICADQPLAVSLSGPLIGSLNVRRGRLLPMILRVLDDAGVERHAFDAVAVGTFAAPARVHDHVLPPGVA
jgi:hypothetical protein